MVTVVTNEKTQEWQVQQMCTTDSYGIHFIFSYIGSMHRRVGGLIWVVTTAANSQHATCTATSVVYYIIRAQGDHIVPYDSGGCHTTSPAYSAGSPFKSLNVALISCDDHISVDDNIQSVHSALIFQVFFCMVE